MKCIIFILLTISLHATFLPLEKVRPSTPDEIASLNSELLITNLVSPISGLPYLSEKELISSYYPELFIQRTYVTPQISGQYHENAILDQILLIDALLELELKSWTFFPHLFAGYNAHSPYFLLPDPKGFVLEFELTPTHGVLKTPSTGCSNFSGKNVSSIFDIRNTQLLVEGLTIRVITPRGIERIYQRKTEKIYRLEKEILTSGRVLFYSYNYPSNGLSRIDLKDPSENYTLASIQKLSPTSFLSSDNLQLNLSYEQRLFKLKYKRDSLFKIKRNTSYPLLKQLSGSKKLDYNSRTLLSFCQMKNELISLSYFENPQDICRVKILSTPSKILSFSYAPLLTTVSSSDGDILFHFNKDLLLIKIEWYQNGKLQKQKLFSYNQNQHIERIETKNESDQTLFEKIYECDPLGNPISETTNTPSRSFQITRTFDQAKLIEEKQENGSLNSYTYLKNTYLPLSKTEVKEQKQEKTLYFYDNFHNLVKIQKEKDNLTEIKTVESS